MSRTAIVTIEHVESHPIGSGIFMLLSEMVKSYKQTAQHKLVAVEVVETYTKTNDEESAPMNATQITWDDKSGRPYSKMAVLIFEADRSNKYREASFVVRYASSIFSEDSPKVSDVHYNVSSMGNALVEICNVFLNETAIVPRARSYPQ